MLSKSELRDTLLHARLALSSEEVAAQSAVIVRELQQIIERSGFHAIHYYEPISSLNEVNIAPLKDYLETVSPKPLLYTSRKHQDQWHTVSVEGQIITELPKYDLIIVPMLGFDSVLHRLGYGGGYYDRLLTEQPEAKKIGVCFEFGKVNQLPNRNHDIPMDVIISERQIYVAERPASS